MEPTFNREDILRTWLVFRQPGEVTEVRILNAGKWLGTVSGYFDNAEDFTKTVSQLAADLEHPVPAIYFTPNPVSKDLLARAANKTKPNAKNTTSDADITALSWLLIDLDAKRPAGISSTDDEHDAAITKAGEVRQRLVDLGWPAGAFVLGDSGNGAHVNVKIDLPNIIENVTLVRGCLEALDFLFSDERIHVDVTSQNPARIWKLYGTMARKGDSTTDRPHRLSRFLEVPDTPAPVSREQLEALAAMLPEPESTQQTSHNTAGVAFDPVSYCQAHKLPVHHTKGWTDKNGAKCTVAVLEQCIFDPNHHTSAVIIGWPNGMRSYRCRHHSCLSKHWKDAKAILEPEGTTKKEKQREDAGSDQEKANGPTVIDAIKALAGVCDGATSKDNMGFSKFDRETHDDLIEKIVTGGELSRKQENTAYALAKKYRKQLKKLGIDFDQIGHIARDDGEGCENALAGIIDRIPAWIEEHHFKTVADTKKIYHYDHGVYLDNGETILETLIGTEFPELVNNKLVSDILGNVKRRTYTDRDLFNNRHVINVKNGLLDLNTLQLQPHTPDYLSTAQLDVLYNSEAKAPKIAKFFQEVAPSGDVALIEEIIGWLLWPDYHIHKAIMLVGPGRNGKGTLLRLITAFMGRKSISNVTLQDLVSDTFAKSDLYGKLANIGGDLPSKDLSDTSAFRNLTGGDDNRAQEKYRPAFNFRNKAKMLFSANVLPRSQDDTYAFYIRWILIEFLNRFVLDDGTADPDLDSKLQTPEELSGLLIIALNGLKRLKANGWKFSYTKTAEDVEVMYKRNANPVFAFLMDECEAGDATDYIEKSVFFDKFNAYVKKHNLRPMSTTKFVELLKDQTEIPVSSFKPWVDHGNRPMCWAGVKFKTPHAKKEGNGEKTPKTPEKGEKPENETDSVGLQSIPSILKPYSTIQEEKNEKGKEKINERIVEYKQTIDGIDCDPLIAVPSEERDEGKLRKKLAGDDPGFKKFQAGMKKRKCCLCDRSFPYDLTPYYANGKSGYICSTCHMQGPPSETQEPEPSPQTSLNESVGRVIRTENVTMQA